MPRCVGRARAWEMVPAVMMWRLQSVGSGKQLVKARCVSEGLTEHPQANLWFKYAHNVCDFPLPGASSP